MSKDNQQLPSDGKSPHDHKNLFALVPKSFGAVEQTSPGRLRILSGMVTETLTLAQRHSPKNRVLSVLVAGSLGEEFDELIRLLIQKAIVQPVNIEVEHCEQVGTLLKALENRKFDLAFVYLHLFSPPPAKERHFTDTPATLHLVERLPENTWITGKGLLTIGLLRRVHGIPVLALTGSGYEGAETFVKQAGAAALINIGCIAEQSFVACVQDILLQSPNQTGNRRAPRIIVVDDEDWMLEFVERIIQSQFPNAIVLTFRNGDEAWQELLREAPDLLVTDMNRAGLNGRKMLPMLAQREVKYPIFVHSGGVIETEVRACAPPNLNVTYLSKPWQPDEFVRKVVELVGDRGRLQNQANRIAKHFRIGDYEFCEPDYLQAVLWAESLSLKPELLIKHLLDNSNLYLDGQQRTLFAEDVGTKIENGRFTSLVSH